MNKNHSFNKCDYDFVLTKSSLSCYFDSITVSFTSPSSQQYPKGVSGQINPNLALPKFNSDGYHYTPSFILPAEEKFYRSNLSFEKVKFEERIQNASQKNLCHTSKMISPLNNYCQVCQSTFLNYMDHINSAHHQKKIQCSFGNNLILDLAANIDYQQVKGKRVRKIKVKGPLGMGNSCTKRHKIKKQAVIQNTKLESLIKNNNQSTNIISNLN